MTTSQWRRATTAFALTLGVACAPGAWAQAADTDGDGVPDGIEPQMGLDGNVKDNDIFNNAWFFVLQQYRDVFQREGDGSGVNYWSGAVDTGAISREALIQTFVRSPEFRNSVAPIVRLYLAYFGRAPDHGGLLYWTGRFQTGTPLEVISEAFAQGPEFANTYGPKTNAEFVQLVYRNVLGRQPDPSGYAHWLGELNAGRLKRGGVMTAFSQSPEYGNLSAPAVVVSMLYSAMMQRTPDPGGFSYWVGRLASGQGDESALISSFFNSVEYRDRFVNVYSMAATPQSIDAARFLTQATFGPRNLGDIANVRKKGYGNWIDEQIGRTAASHLAYVSAGSVRRNTGFFYDEDAYEAIWQQWLFGEDQLRARMSFALSEIFVISNIAPNLDARAMSSYMDMLNMHAFSSYRTLLEEVTLHPAMGFYLDMLKSQKEDANGRRPNENYAREVLQLFSVGLTKLNPDGTPILDGAGKPVPTFDEDTVYGFAKAFTGWGFSGANTADPKTFQNAKANWISRMVAWPSQHSTAEKRLLDGYVIPPNGTPEADLKAALDNIFYHPNVGPFICRQLIQRLVTSNPSRGQIQRCSTTFGNDGAGARGNLGAVVKAILLDPEARDPATAMSSITFGKQKEPVIRFASFLRAFGARSSSGRNGIHYLDSPDDSLGQSPLLAPSVFNFFSPNFRPTGPVAAMGLVAPEFQITTETSVVGAINFFSSLADKGYWGSGDTRLNLDYSTLQPIALDPPKLADHLNMLFMAGSMTPGLKDTLVRALTAMPTNNTRNRVEAALMIMSASPDFVIQK